MTWNIFGRVKAPLTDKLCKVKKVGNAKRQTGEERLITE